MNEIESKFVKPFYLKMMGLNAPHSTAELEESLIAAGRAVTAPDVIWMLRTASWRPVVMGAWFSLAIPAESIRNDLLQAMSESRGSLTASPLAAASTLVAGDAGVHAMADYIDFMLATPERRDGSESIVAAAMEYLGADRRSLPPKRTAEDFEISTKSRRTFVRRSSGSPPVT